MMPTHVLDPIIRICESFNGILLKEVIGIGIHQVMPIGSSFGMYPPYGSGIWVVNAVEVDRHWITYSVHNVH